MDNKPYLINVCSWGDGALRYLLSLPKLQRSAHVVWVEFEPHCPMTIQPKSVLDTFMGVSSDISIMREDGSYPGPHFRWKYIPYLDQNRWHIFTDTWDVVLQRPIPDLDQFGADVLVQSEGMTHEENPVWGPYIKQVHPEFSHLLSLPVYCCGVVAAKGRLMQDLIHAETSADPNVWDQLPFNEWLIGKNFKDCRELSIALYGNAYDERANVMQTADGGFLWGCPAVVPAIVHGNGSGKEFLPKNSEV